MTPDQLYTQIYFQTTKAWTEVAAFREVSKAGLEVATPVIERRKLEDVRELMARPDFPSFLKDFDALNDLGAEGLAALTAKASMVSARAAIDAASLVFAHSIVDASAMGHLRVAAMARPEDWQQFLDKKQWSVSDVRENRYESLFRGLLTETLDHMDRNWSLIRKGERLRQVCRPEKDWQLQLKYDEEELKRIDDRRHSVVHGNQLGQALSTIESDLEFLKNLGWYFFVIVHKRYRTRLIIDP